MFISILLIKIIISFTISFVFCLFGLRHCTVSLARQLPLPQVLNYCSMCSQSILTFQYHLFFMYILYFVCTFQKSILLVYTNIITYIKDKLAKLWNTELSGHTSNIGNKTQNESKQNKNAKRKKNRPKACVNTSAREWCAVLTSYKTPAV